MKNHSIAVVLAAGCGKRMNSSIKKQYLLIHEKPLLYHTLNVFEKSFIDEIVVVTGKDEVEFCRENIVCKYHFDKVTGVIPGGAQRYDSVYEALKWIEREKKDGAMVFIHDAARPLVTEEILIRTYECACEHGSGIAGVPVKDTIKVVDSDGIVKDTPKRSTLWMVQTPQVFPCKIIKSAYDKLFALEKKERDTLSITDDAMVLETFGTMQVHMAEGSYQNIKITTPDDLFFAEKVLSNVEKTQ